MSGNPEEARLGVGQIALLAGGAVILALTLGLDPTQILAFTGVFIVGGISLLRINWKNRITQIEDILEKHYRFWLSLVVFSFLSLVFVVAVIAIRVPSASTFNTVAGSLVTVEGLLLGLIGLAPRWRAR